MLNQERFLAQLSAIKISFPCDKTFADDPCEWQRYPGALSGTTPFHLRYLSSLRPCRSTLISGARSQTPN